MNTISLNSNVTDEQRRQQLFDGQLFVYTPGPSATALVDFARHLIENAFGKLDPLTAQHQLAPEAYEALLTTFKPTFINHAESKRLVRNLLVEMGCDPDLTYFDVPRMRTATSHGYLNRGISYAFESHRDTWFSGPLCQINWWLPIYEYESGNSLAFHPDYWNRAIANGSLGYNCHEWYAEGRRIAQTPGMLDRRVRPEPHEKLILDPQVRLVTPPGTLTVFSAAHLHSTVPNFTGKTRFSIDFRTVHSGDLRHRHGAPNYDSACTGTTLADYFRLSDQQRLPAELIHSYEGGTPLLERTWVDLVSSPLS
ncbi:hypothetical protein GCM10027346_42040 [Hymenobacter seoulensis]